MSDIKDSALALIKSQRLCVISTVSSEGKPESAVVGFSINEKFEVIIGTSKKSRKFNNILQNPNVAIVFGPQEMRAVQYEGLVKQLEGEELAARKKHHFEVHPWAVKYESDPDQTYFLVTPQWIRLVEAGPVVLGEETEFN
ncbi:MAG: Pyridoxamine 5-phosphate oxidase [Candidatus Saccharibacteria bacterium]|nr:Pyridoxamine 5-phosphate oxidase [Candidatus Saccharibacteria bacterium]